ncbi:S24 family peptidase [Desnuesiella massiliensis]|uniref:S24 family peptidase n=1 Tax=Desnuesiella massiliensis TaxID=1650662 RepID=UPI0006E16A35|nr:S24 family peptidase [Desnuesiella massiliensis]
MILNTQQRKIINSKPCKYSLLKGSLNTGKTTTSLHRALYLKNNYCLYEEDRILIVTASENKTDVINKYDTVLTESKSEYLSLFSSEDKDVHIFSIDELVDLYCKKYMLAQELNFKLLTLKEEKLRLVEEAIIELNSLYNVPKLLNTKYAEFFLEEISWIKAMNLTELAEYQCAERTGRKVNKGQGPQRIVKNSNYREIIFELMLLYNIKLGEKGFIDHEDKCLFALEQSLRFYGKGYTHIVIDSIQKLNKCQFDFLISLGIKRDYSTFTFIYDNFTYNKESNSYFVKNGKLNLKGFPERPKINILKYNFGEVTPMQQDLKAFSMESYIFQDLRFNKRFNFIRDNNKADEIIVKEDGINEVYSQDELDILPMYTDIAAGEPLLINPELQDSFYLPKYWIKNMRNCFMLKVKGDSMIGANIQDGDYVIIRKQSSAQNNDIVAVDLDGSATLKRLSLRKGLVRLMPENTKYSPIVIEDNNASIIGIALAVVKPR